MRRFVPPLDLLFESSEGVVHHECRECGRNLSDETENCPACGGDPITYEFR